MGGFPSLRLSAQSRYPGEQLFEKGIGFFAQNEIDSAIYCWEGVLKYFKEDSPEYGNAMLNLGVAYEIKGDWETSKKWYKTMLLVNLNELAPPVEEGDQYASYKHHACMRLSTMYSLDNNYSQALRYVKLAQSPYTYKTTDGLAFEKRQINIALWESAFYEKMSKGDSALYVLNQKIFDREVAPRLPSMETFGFADYAEITTKALAFIDKRYTRPKFKAQLDQALTNIKLSQEGLITKATFTVAGFTYTLLSMDADADKQHFADQVLTSTLYRAL